MLYQLSYDKEMKIDNVEERGWREGGKWEEKMLLTYDEEKAIHKADEEDNED